MKYQVGDLVDFKENDPVFDSFEAALAHAKERSVENKDFPHPQGIWISQQDGSQLRFIVHENTPFACASWK